MVFKYFKFFYIYLIRFVTFTGNPKWPELVGALQDGQEYTNRADIVCKYFIDKIEEFTKDICYRHILGKVAAWCYSVEHQKRGETKLIIFQFLNILACHTSIYSYFLMKIIESRHQSKLINMFVHEFRPYHKSMICRLKQSSNVAYGKLLLLQCFTTAMKVARDQMDCAENIFQKNLVIKQYCQVLMSIVTNNSFK